MNIRIASPEDLPRIVGIYNQAIPSQSSTADMTPVRIEDRQAWFAEHDPRKYPIFVAEREGVIVGWCSLTAWRPGRMALRFTAEISCFIDHACQRKGVGTALVEHALAASPGLQIKNVFAVLLDRNEASRTMLEKLGFERWGYLPRVADFDGVECGQLFFGKRVWD